MNDFKELPVLVLDEQNMTGKGIGAQAINVSQDQHNVILQIMADDRILSTAYKLRKECNAFFQGGCAWTDPTHWVYLEFWSKDLTKINTFLAYINFKLGQNTGFD